MRNLPDGFYLVTYDDNYEKAVVRKVNYEVIGIKSFNPKYGKSAYNYTIFSDGWDSYKIQKYGIKHYYETL